MNSNKVYHEVSLIKKTNLYKLMRYIFRERIGFYRLYKSKEWFKYHQFDFYSFDETIGLLASGKYSLIRFADGEFTCMAGGMKNIWAGSSKCDVIIKESLINITQSKSDKILIGITTNPPGRITVNNSPMRGLNSIEYIYYKYIHKLVNFFPLERKYVNSGLFLLYHYGLNSREEIDHYYRTLTNIWDCKKVVFVCSLEGRFDPEDDLFNNVSEKNIVYCNSVNAHHNLDEIQKKCLEYPKEYLFILSCGFLAKILALNLSNCGYQAIDVGHLTFYKQSYLNNEE